MSPARLRGTLLALGAVLAIAVVPAPASRRPEDGAVGGGVRVTGAVADGGLLVAMIGDSNATGISDSDRADPAFHATEPFAGCRYNARQAAAVHDPPSWLDLPTGDLRPYAPGGQAGMGFEVALGRTLADASDAPWLAKQAINGATLAAEWSPSAAFPSGVNLFGQWVARIHALEAESGRALSAVVVSLGTNDAADAGQAAAFGDHMAALCAAVRAEFGAGLPIAWIATNGHTVNAHTATVRAAQLAYAATDPDLALIDNDDLALTDGLHYEANGYLTLGQRIGFAVLDRLGYPRAAAGAAPEVVGWGPAAYGAGAQAPRSWPGTIAGDLEYLYVLTWPEDVAIATPDGWTAVAGTAQASTTGSGTQRGALFERRITEAMLDANAGRPPATRVVSDNQQVAAVSVTVRAASPTTAAAGGGATHARGAALAIPGIAASADELVLGFAGGASGSPAAELSASNPALTELTERRDGAYLIGNDFQVFALTTGRPAAPGPTGTTTVTSSVEQVLVGATVSVAP